ncbi:MAG: SCO family protein [Proteobacteria bacterium]|nr:SCO family protein [Pseudomonadota bacterium]
MKYPVNRLFAWAGAASIVLAVALLWRHELAPPGASRLTLESAGAAGPTIGGSFTLVDHNGKTVTARDFRGRFMLVYFGYTYCPDVCPTTLTTMADAIDILDGDGDSVVPVFITVDPERDTPEHLKMYVNYFHPRLVGLTGTSESVAAAAKAYRIYYAKARQDGASGDDYLMDHLSFVFLMGPDGAFRAHFENGIGPEAMAKRIREYL